MDCQQIAASIVTKNAEYQVKLATQAAANAAKLAADQAVNQTMMELQYLNWMWQTYCQSA